MKVLGSIRSLQTFIDKGYLNVIYPILKQRALKIYKTSGKKAVQKEEINVCAKLDYTWYKPANRSKVCPFAKSHRQRFIVIYIKQAFLVRARETREQLYKLNCLQEYFLIRI